MADNKNKRDELLFEERKQLLETVTEFHKNEKNRITLLDGEWGSGKSFFIDKFIEEIKNKNDIVPIKFDCWLHQGDSNINDIFLEVVYKELNDKAHKNLKEYINKNKINILNGSNKFLLKLLPLSEATSYLYDGVTNVAKEVDEVKKYELYNNIILNGFMEEKNFYEILFSLLFELNESAEDKQYIFIFDELDRCEPDYAISLLKKVVYINKEIRKKDGKKSEHFGSFK